MSFKDAEWVICGDFNEVRNESERLNCDFMKNRAARFNQFIEDMQLLEIPLMWKRFTRVSDNGMKLSKLDRFLVSKNFLQSWGDLSVVALDRNTSDHCPIVLSDKNINFGPKPFKVFDTWFKNKDIEKIIIDAWNKQVTSTRDDVIFRNKMKNVKEALRSWSKSQYGNLDDELKMAKDKTADFEKRADLN
ncbi:uncharacterized protein [Rutidosis leptorrhynchoides]|uniref:uncharacterized protein n=1 Tax=Rutidosis leptorrhynchoides TaxID=125765 RepID=UPI003A990276